MSAAIDDVDVSRADFVRRGRLLEYFTLAWNLLEAAIAIFSGIIAGSISLVGFGIDSVIECLSGGVLLWRLREGEHGESREKIALKLVGASFLALAAYIGYEAIRSLMTREPPAVSYVGICIASLSLVVMPLLARAKRKVAASIHSHALEADARQSDLCTYLSAILLGGLILNAVFGWWWADPVAGLIMITIIAKEGVDALRGKNCGDCH